MLGSFVLVEIIPVWQVLVCQRFLIHKH